MKFAFIYQESLKKEHFMYAMVSYVEKKADFFSSKKLLADVKVLWGNYFCMKAEKKKKKRKE